MKPYSLPKDCRPFKPETIQATLKPFKLFKAWARPRACPSLSTTAAFIKNPRSCCTNASHMNVENQTKLRAMSPGPSNPQSLNLSTNNPKERNPQSKPRSADMKTRIALTKPYWGTRFPNKNNFKTTEDISAELCRTCMLKVSGSRTHGLQKGLGLNVGALLISIGFWGFLMINIV